ncbi:MAG: cation-translocating P-type ATPase [Firmicutes bacterium]|nr:cation-translocating P-type ATPase [Bacillota bacterium]
MSNAFWHAFSTARVLAQLQADPERGLTPAEAKHRLAHFGPNELPSQVGPGLWQMLVDQFRDVMIMVLLGAILVSLFLGEYLDALTIITIVLLNAILGCIQEFRAERSLELLKELAAPQGTVIRGGNTLVVDAREIVPGDLVKISQGDRVPADLRLLESYSLEVDESALTGESVPVSKDHRARAAQGVLVGDRRNMLHMGTVVTRGRGLGVVVATGGSTEIGRIARLIHQVQDEPTPLQRRLAKLGGFLVKACLAVCLLVFALGIIQGRNWTEMFLTGVSLAVAAIPEGLPAVVTISLALGVQRMIKRKAIIRKLSAVETLGCTSVICSDKTGTLTKNEMTVTTIWLPKGKHFRVSGEGYSSKGIITDGLGNRASLEAEPGLARLVEVIAFCNNAELVKPRSKGKFLRRKNGSWEVQGDPMEGALLVLAKKAGLDLEGYTGVRLKEEIPFDSDRKRMSVILEKEGEGTLVYTKGALDVLIKRCRYYLSSAGVRPLTSEVRDEVIAAAESMSSSGLRVLGVAYKDHYLGSSGEEAESDQILVGIVGLVDPPRPEVASAIALASKAGIRTYMVTGDHKLTAVSIARQIGLYSGARQGAISGEELESLTDSELLRRLDQVSVFARVSPEHKIRLVRLFKKKGEVVAMTGDGVNDAPAIREADIGVSMGQCGTDVAKEASAMVLSDDNYATIVAAVEEGRGIFENIRKFIRYLLGCNTGEVLTMLLASFFNLPLPLVAVQILMMNLVTDGLPAIALSVDPANPRIMERPPRRVDEGIFSGGLLKTILLQGTLIALGTIGVFIFSLLQGSALAGARTMAFATLVMSQLLYVFRCRGADSQGFFRDLISNPYLTLAVLVSAGFQLLILYHPLLRKLFQVTRLSGGDWGIILGTAFFVSWLEDLAVEAIRSLKRNIMRVFRTA